MSEFFLNLILKSGVEAPTDEPEFDDVFNPTNLAKIKKIQRTGVYQIFGYRSDCSEEEEERLYVGKSKTRDVGVRAHEQLTQASRTFRNNVTEAGYEFCMDRNNYEKLKEQLKAIYVTRVKIMVFPHSAKGEAGRDITEILLINSGEKPALFNDEYTDSTPIERLAAEETKELFKHQVYDGVSEEEIKNEKMSIGELKDLFTDCE